jgi:predicted component of viral defense system (DUF524 family)
MEVRQELEIDLSHLSEGLVLYIIARKDNSLFFDANANKYCESSYQLLEGHFYEYEFSDSNYYFCKNQIVNPNKKSKHIGTIVPNSYVGTLNISIYHENNEVGNVEVEVQSLKADYRSDYREMLEQITEMCTELIMQVNSPVSHHFESNYSDDSKTLFQRFEFLKSFINDDKFYLALQKVLSSPETNWAETQENIDIRKARRFTNSNIKEIATSKQRITITGLNHLEAYGIYSVPRTVGISQKIDSYDNPENRFIKYTIEEYLSFCIEVNNRAEINSKVYKESLMIIEELESYLSNKFFSLISKPTTFLINSPVLQRKEGYREIFRYWLMFDSATKLAWKGGEDIYSAGKKNVALLYEYWIFFKLLEILQEIFEFNKEDFSKLIKTSPSGFELQLKQGECSALKGYYDRNNKRLKFKFSYNRTFMGRKIYPHAGSWSVTLRPDYTLSLWPYSLKEEEAEKEELIMHLHFDAKYKLDNLDELLNFRVEENYENDDVKNEIGKFKNSDLIKMHAYKDAIRRTLGAYILYPGKETAILYEYQDPLPGIGAYTINPSGINIESDKLKLLIDSAVNYFLYKNIKGNNIPITKLKKVLIKKGL